MTLDWPTIKLCYEALVYILAIAYVMLFVWTIVTVNDPPETIDASKSPLPDNEGAYLFVHSPNEPLSAETAAKLREAIEASFAGDGPGQIISRPEGMRIYRSIGGKFVEVEPVECEPPHCRWLPGATWKFIQRPEREP